jgi:hypothetical protein
VVTITGLEASGSDLQRITFGSTFVPVESTDEGLSTVMVPAGSGAGVVSVTADEHGAEVVTQFEYDEAVHVESIRPSSGGIMGGTRITVTGRGFNADEGFCKFGGREDTSTRIVSVLSSNLVVCITPSSSEAGTVTVEVSTNEGLSYSRDQVQFTFYNEPVLTQVIPLHAAARGGSSITFVGGNFADSSDLTCRFGMKSVTRSLRPSASMVVCTAPASNPGNVSIEVSNNGLDFTRTGLRFIFRGVLTFGLVPSRGPVVGGTW